MSPSRKYPVKILTTGIDPDISRSTIRGIDAILAITEPSCSSVQVTKKLLKFARDLGIKIPFSKGILKASMNRNFLYRKNPYLNYITS